MRWSSGSGSVTGWNVSRPTTSSTGHDLDPRSPDAVEQRRGEVQAGGRRRCRAGLGGVHRLVAVGPVEAAVDVGRQWHLAVPGEQLERIVVARQLDRERVAGGGARADHGDGHAVESEQRLAAAEAAGRPDQCLPRAPGRVARLEQQDLRRPAGGPVQAEPGRDDPRLVDHDDVAGAQQIGELGHGAVLGRRAPPVDEQAGRVPWFDRHLGDAILRQLVVELVEAHDPRGYGRRTTRRLRSAHDQAAPVGARPGSYGRPAMTTLRTDHVPLDEGAMDLHLWIPDAGPGPGLLLIQEIFGVGPYVRARRRAPRRRRLHRRRAGRVLALRAWLGRRPRRGRPGRVVGPGGQPGPAAGDRRLRRRARPPRHRRHRRASGRHRFLPRRHAGVRRRHRLGPGGLRQLLRLGRPGHDRPPRRGDLPDAVPLRQRRQLHPGRGCRAGGGGDRRP